MFMNTKTTLSISEARKKIFDIADEVQKPNTYYTLTEKGKPKVVIVGAEEFESWIETLEVVKDFPNLREEIEGAHKDFAKGDYVTLDQLLLQEGYELPTHHSKKSAKRSAKT